MMQKVNVFLLYAVLFFSLSSLTPKSDHVKWLSIADAQTSMHKEKRPILIDLYTDWCGWCKVMDRKTYANQHVVEYLQKNFYPVRVNAETREKITWNEKDYNYNKAYRANEFALYITSGRLEFPTTVIIPPDGSGPQAIPGYLETKDFEMILKYFGEGKYGNVSFEDYQKQFKSVW